MGPIALFDKSFLQSLSIDESVWFDHFFYTNICPLFYVETLADLTKSSSSRSAEDIVRIIADKTPVLSGAPCVHHKNLCISNLLGQPVSMKGQIPMVGGRHVKSPDGKRGVVYDQSPEAEAFNRWQKGEFLELERKFAVEWRRMLTTLDLPSTAERIQKLGVNSKECKSIEEAHAIAYALVNARKKPFDQMALLFAFVDIPSELQRPILERWSIDQYRPLTEYAPFAAHVLMVELFFQIALAANLISAERASNRIDIAYFFYLPFCMVFISGDKLHRKCAEVFLRKDQEFIWGPALKTELGRINSEFATLPESVLSKGLMKFAPSPTGSSEHLLVRLWDKYTPNWKSKKEASISLKPDAEKRLIEHLKSFTNATTVDPKELDISQDLDQVAIQHIIPKRKGSWWLLPKDLKVDKDDLK